MKATGIILVGGKSSRMGTNKALLPIGGKKVIERIAEKMEMITDHLIIVTNTFQEYEFLNLPMVADMYKGLGLWRAYMPGWKRPRLTTILLRPVICPSCPRKSAPIY